MLAQGQRAAGVAMRLLPNIRYGTESYPEKVARRLRAVNITAWFAAAVILFFALARLTDPVRWPFGVVTALFAVAIAAVPLLHRFGLWPRRSRSSPSSMRTSSASSPRRA